MTRLPAFYRRESFIYIIAVLASVFLSLWIDCRETVINPDAICYLLSAHIINQSGISGAMHLCGQAQWPFYSFLIHSVAEITHLSYTLTAYIIDGIFSALSVLTFILIIKELGGSRRVLWLAALVILLSHEFNSIRQYIVRDHGFWAFYLGSILFLLRYFREPSLVRALVWNLSILMATLFRIEGAIFLITMPFLAWFFTRYSLHRRLQNFIHLNLLTLLCCVIIGVILLMHPQHNAERFGRLVEVPHQIQNGVMLIIDRFEETKMAMIQHVLNDDSDRDAGMLLFLIWIASYFINVIGNVSLGYALLVLYAWKNRVAHLTSTAAVVLYGYLGINIIITLAFLAERMFLSKRYLIALSLVLMLWVPFALNDLIKKWPSLRHRLFLLLTIILIFISSLGGLLHFGYSKDYVRDAGDWLSQNVPAKSSLYANDIQVMYYSNHFGDEIFDQVNTYQQTNLITQEQWKHYDFIALRVSKKEIGHAAQIVQSLPLTPVQTFKNERGDQVLIYKVMH